MANLKDLIVNGAARVIGKTYSSEFVGNVAGDVTGNAATSSKLKTARSLKITDDGTNISTGVDFDGSDAVTLKLPSTIKASLAGNATTATTASEFVAELATAATDRYVYFAYDDPAYNNSNASSVTKGRAVVDSDFKYNPGTSTLTVGTFKGNLAASNITGTLGVGHGGTGIASFTAGDILYASGTSTLATLNKGTDGQVLKLSGGKPAWGTDNTPTKFAWTNGATAGPTGSLTGNGMSAVNFAAIPSASESASGIVTTGAQAFAGAKTFADTTDSTNNTSGAVIVSGGLGVAKNIYAAAVHNAVWNDLVDCMEVPEDTSLEFGYCYSWKGDSVIKSSRSSKNCIGIHSNTAGFVMGEKKTKTIQAAVAGFVLAYVDKLYPEGTPLTWGDGGVLTKCSSLKRILHPERVIATFYREEKEKKWHDLPVLGRHWVKIV